MRMRIPSNETYTMPRVETYSFAEDRPADYHRQHRRWEQFLFALVQRDSSSSLVKDIAPCSPSAVASACGHGLPLWVASQFCFFPLWLQLRLYYHMISPSNWLRVYENIFVKLNMDLGSFISVTRGLGHTAITVYLPTGWLQCCLSLFLEECLFFSNHFESSRSSLHVYLVMVGSKAFTTQ